MSKNAPDFGAYVRFVQVSAPFFCTLRRSVRSTALRATRGPRKPSAHRMLLGNERNYDLGMDALATACSWETNGIMIETWMLWPPYALGKRTEL